MTAWSTDTYIGVLVKLRTCIKRCILTPNVRYREIVSTSYAFGATRLWLRDISRVSGSQNLKMIILATISDMSVSHLAAQVQDSLLYLVPHRRDYNAPLPSRD